MNKQFWGIYACYLEQYIAFKRALGFKYDTEETIYSIFDRFTVERGETTLGITKDLADAWCRLKPNESDSYRYHRVVCLHQLSSFLCKAGFRSFVPQLPVFKPSFTPYIFSQGQITAICKACDEVSTKKKYSTPLSSSFRLLSGCCMEQVYGSVKLCPYEIKMST